MPKAQEGDVQPTRRSARLKPTDPAAGLFSEQTADPDQPVPTTEIENNMSVSRAVDGETMEDKIARLEATIARLESCQLSQAPSSIRVTPDSSAFQGPGKAGKEKDPFKPSGAAAHPAFEPYNSSKPNRLDKNTEYDVRARATQIELPVYKGKADDFDDWLTAFTDKVEEDQATFKKERSRMALLYSKLDGAPKGLLEARYRAIKEEDDPFSCVAEMVQVLAAVYQDDNQAFAARAELTKMMFDPSEGEIYDFIARLNKLANRAEYTISSLKTLLYEHLPPNMDPRLLGDSKDPNLSYEDYCNRVANAAYVSKKTAEYNRVRTSSSRNRGSGAGRVAHAGNASGRRGSGETGTRSAGAQQTTASSNKKATTSRQKGAALTFAEKKVHWDAGTCFICGKAGHQSPDCPDRVNAVGSAGQDDEEIVGNSEKD